MEKELLELLRNKLAEIEDRVRSNYRPASHEEEKSMDVLRSLIRALED